MPLPYELYFPQALDFMRDSQPLMLTNYASIFTFINTDHVPFNSGVNTPGQHMQMTFPELAADPTASNNYTFYNKTSPFSNLIALFMQDSFANVIGFSDKNIRPQGEACWVQLPSGVIIKWVVLPVLSTSQPRTLVWQQLGDTKPFSTQFWAAVFTKSSTGNFDSNQVSYITSVLNPAQVGYMSWTRASFNVPVTVTDQLVIVAIGV